jgi:nitric oxide reductase NorD protein
MKPKRSTRMGPAIRHTVRKLIASGNALKVLLIISDGFPQDCDYGPERGEHEYGVQDTARALRRPTTRGWRRSASPWTAPATTT